MPDHEINLNINDFDEWLEDLVFPGDVGDFIEVLYDGGQSEGDGNFEMKKKVLFYTYNNQYCITAIDKGKQNKGYLGCTVSARKIRAGENWTRGNDLPDGPFNHKTLEQIKNRIIAYELEQLSVKRPQDPIEEEIIR